MKLTEEVLVLHPSIQKAFILEERAGKLFAVEEASRVNGKPLAEDIDEALSDGTLTPALLIGAATQFSKYSNTLKFVSVLYETGGVMFTTISETRLLAIATEPSGFHQALENVSKSLPDLIKRRESGKRQPGTVKSAAEAEDIAKTYVTRAGNASNVSIEEVAFNEATGRWDVQGSYHRSLAGSKKFHVELDAEQGAVMGFASTPDLASATRYVEIAAILGGLSLLAWLLSSNLLRW